MGQHPTHGATLVRAGKLFLTFVSVFSSPHSFMSKMLFFLMLHSKDNALWQVSLFGLRLHCTLPWGSQAPDSQEAGSGKAHVSTPGPG